MPPFRAEKDAPDWLAGVSLLRLSAAERSRRAFQDPRIGRSDFPVAPCGRLRRQILSVKPDRAFGQWEGIVMKAPLGERPWETVNRPLRGLRGKAPWWELQWAQALTESGVPWWASRRAGGTP